MPAKHGGFVWNELMTSDVEKSKTFYQKTLGWTFEAMPMPEGTYWIAKSGSETAGGLMDMKGVTPPGVPPHWFSYIEVDDVDARTAKVKASGGQVMREPFDIPGVGRIAIIADATGAHVGIMTSAAQAQAAA